MKRMLSAVLFAPVTSIWLFAAPAYAQGAMDIEQLYSELQAAVCLNDWDSTLALLEPMIASSSITDRYRNDLIQFRQQVEQWQGRQAQFINQPNCESVDRPSETPAADASLAPLLAQCAELGNVVNWTDSQATSLLSRTDIADIDSLVIMLSGLARVSEEAVSSLRSLQVADGQLQTYQQEFIAIYEGFRQATQGFVQAADAGEFTTMEQSNNQVQTLANRELALINQVNDYCGRDIIANN